MTETNRLRIAMQKSGRLSDDSQDLLERCGLKVRYHAQRLLAMAENMPVEILRVRDDDIPGLVMDGVVDLGICKLNNVHTVLSKCRSDWRSWCSLASRNLQFDISFYFLCHWNCLLNSFFPD